MKNLTAALPLALLLLGACSRNPDPEYAPDNDQADAAAVAVEAEVAAGPVNAPAPAPGASAAPEAAPAEPKVPEDRAMTLGREAVAMIFEGRIEELWPRLDADMHAALSTPAAFTDMSAQIFSQIGPEVTVVSEIVAVPPENTDLTYYRRRSNYLLTGEMLLDMHVVFSPDETIAGITIRPAEE